MVTSQAHPQEALKSGNYTTTEGRRGVRARDLLVGVEAALSGHDARKIYFRWA